MLKKREEKKDLSQLRVKEVKVKERKLAPKLVKGGARISLPAPDLRMKHDPGEESAAKMERSKA